MEEFCAFFVGGNRSLNMKKTDLLLYAITDRAWLGEETLAQQVEKALRGGTTMVQLREKHLTGEALEEEARTVQAVCQKYHVPFLINDDVLLAQKINADGVHIGQCDMALGQARALLGAHKIIGVTAKTVEQARAAEAGGADYLGSGAVFGTSTKFDTKKMDHELLDEICGSVRIPVVAIGGISSDNILKLKGRKMAGVAVVSGIFQNDDIEGATKKLRMLAEEIVM
jgi:thiamine-phosphate pyrophosphorylase